MDVIRILNEIIAEIIGESEIPRRVALHAVVEAAVEVTQEQKLEFERHHLPPELLVGEALNKIKAVNVIDGDPIPPHQLEALKELIKKVALRKIRELEEEQLRKEGHGRKGKKKEA